MKGTPFDKHVLSAVEGLRVTGRDGTLLSVTAAKPNIPVLEMRGCSMNQFEFNGCIMANPDCHALPLSQS